MQYENSHLYVDNLLETSASGMCGRGIHPMHYGPYEWLAGVPMRTGEEVCAIYEVSVSLASPSPASASAAPSRRKSGIVPYA